MKSSDSLSTTGRVIDPSKTSFTTIAYRIVDLAPVTLREGASPDEIREARVNAVQAELERGIKAMRREGAL